MSSSIVFAGVLVPLLTAQIEPPKTILAAVEATTRRTRDLRIGESSRELSAFEPVSPARVEQLGLEPPARHASIEFRGRPFHVVVAGSGDSSLPTTLRVWTEEAPAPLAAVAIPWKVVVAGRFWMARAEHRGDWPFAVSLQWNEGALSGAALDDEVLHATFDFQGRPYRVDLIDADLDGRISGAADRWVAGPAERIDALRFPNPATEMSRVDEPWCLGAESLWFEDWRGDRVRISARPPVDRSALRARIEARVLEEYVSRIGISREAFLDKQGEDPRRPIAERLTTWSWVDTLEEAKAARGADPRPLLIVFTSRSCGWCRFLSWGTHWDAEVDALLQKFFAVKIDTQFSTDGCYERLGCTAVPCTVLVGMDDRVIDSMRGFVKPSEYARTLQKWLDLPRS